MSAARTINRHAFMEIVQDAGLDVSGVREAYSGRGMYGRECVAVSLDSDREAYALFATMAEMICNEDVAADFTAADLASAARSETLGLGTVLFFPGFVLSEAT